MYYLDSSSSKKRLFLISLLGLLVLVNGVIFSVYLYRKSQVTPARTNTASLSSQPAPTDAAITSTLSIVSLTPLYEGNPFEDPIRIPGTNKALYSIGGRVFDIGKNKDNTWHVSVIKDTGQVISDVLTVPANFQISVATVQNGENHEERKSIDTLQKDEQVVVSVNITIDTKKIEVSDIRVTR